MINPNWQPKPLFALGDQTQAWTAPPAAAKKKPSFLQSLIPSAGGLGGGILGGALGGAAAGTAIFPGIGTAGGALLGALFGGALGGAGGKVVENKLTGESLTHDVAKEGAIQGVLSAGPLRLAKGLGVGGKALVAGGDAAAEGAVNGSRLLSALNKGAEAAAAPSAIKTAIAGKLGGTSDNLAQRALKMNDSKFATQFANRSNEEVGAFANRFGLVGKPAAVSRETIYKPASDLYGQAIESIGAIGKKEVMANVKADATKLLSSKLPEKQALGKELVTKANTILKGYGDAIPATKLNSLKSEIYQTIDKSVTDSAGKYANNINDKLANSLRKTINTAAERSGVKVDPALAKLGFKSNNVGDLGQELFHLDQLLGKIDVKSRVGIGSAPFSMGSYFGGAAGGAAGGPAGAAGGALSNMVLNSNPGRRSLARGAEALAERAAMKASKSGALLGTEGGVQAAMNIAKRAVPVDLTRALVDSQPSMASMNANATNAANTDTNTIIDPSSAINGEESMPTEDTNNPFAPENVEANIQKIIASGGKMKDVTDYVSLVDALQTIQAKSGPARPKLSASQVQLANNANSGLNDLAALAQEIERDPSVLVKASIPGGKLARSATGTIGYESAKQNVVDVIARLRSGAAITDDEARRYMSLLPGLGDNKQTAAAKLQRLHALLSDFANPVEATADTIALGQ